MSKPDINDAIGFAGLILFLAGVARLSLSIAMILAGLILFAFSWTMAGRKSISSAAPQHSEQEGIQ